MVAKKPKSHRKSARIIKIIKKKAKASRKRMKKATKGKRKVLKKDPGIPNLYPFKKQLLQKILKGKELAEKEKKDQKNQILEEKRNKKREQNDSEKNLKRENVPKNKKYGKMLEKVIEISDVILFVVDARDPNGCRNINLEETILSKWSNSLNSNKKLVLLINKMDLVPAEVIKKWLEYLKRDRVVIGFKASTQDQRNHLGASKTKQKNISDKESMNTNLSIGTETLFSLLKKYSKCYEGKGSGRTITVGVVGYPNVGKSSVINSIKRKKIAATSSVPGFTKNVQEVIIDKKLKLLDSPGVIFSGETNYSTLVLKNSLRIDSIKNPEDFISQILKKCPVGNLCEVYQIPPFKDTEEFLNLVANRKGMLQKGGLSNIDATARAVIRDWNSGKIAYYTEAPDEKPEGDKIKVLGKKEGSSSSSKMEGLEYLEKQNKDDLRKCEMQDENAASEGKIFVEMHEQ